MKCNRCGAEFSDANAFCPQCGAPRSASPAEQTPPQPQSNQGAYQVNGQPVYPPQPQPQSNQGAYQQPVNGQPVYPPQPQPQSNQGAYQQPVNGQPVYPSQSQPVYIQVQQVPQVQQAPQPVTASPAEKEAFFSTAGGVWMLIATIVFTINLVTSLIGNILSLSLLNIAQIVIFILMDIGLWLMFASAKKKKLGSKGVSLVKVPYIINFVFLVIAFLANLTIWFVTFNVISLFFGILTFVFQCICFSSVKKTLDMASAINSNQTVAGRKAGSFAAVVMIISASLTLISDLISYFVMAVILEALKNSPLAELASLLVGGSVMTIVAAVVSFLASIALAIVLLQFAKRIKRANN